MKITLVKSEKIFLNTYTVPGWGDKVPFLHLTPVPAWGYRQRLYMIKLLFILRRFCSPMKKAFKLYAWVPAKHPIYDNSGTTFLSFSGFAASNLMLERGRDHNSTSVDAHPRGLIIAPP